MTLESQINFYLSDRYPKLLPVVTRNGHKSEKEISGAHYMYISWRRIVKNYHPRKFPKGTEIRQKAADLCKYAIEYRYSVSQDEEEIAELRAAYKSVENAETKPGEATQIPG